MLFFKLPLTPKQALYYGRLIKQKCSKQGKHTSYKTIGRILSYVYKDALVYTMLIGATAKTTVNLAGKRADNSFLIQAHHPLPKDIAKTIYDYKFHSKL